MKYFTHAQLDSIRFCGPRIEVGDAEFEARDGKLFVLTAPESAWLKNFLVTATPDQATWETVAYLKVRHFNTPERVIGRARDGSLYDEDYYRKRGGGGPYIGYSGNDALKSEFTMLARELNVRFAAGEVLDCGCATGLLVRELKARGREASGADVSSWAVQNAVVSGIHQMDGRDLAFEDDRFSVLISQDYMEHIHPDDHERVFSEQIRVCANGAHLVHFIPFYETVEPYQLDAHLCNASREWWMGRIGSIPQLTIVQEPSLEQWDMKNGMLARYLICRVDK